MDSGSLSPGSVKGDSVPESPLSRGKDRVNEEDLLGEQAEAGLWLPRVEAERTERLDAIRIKLAEKALELLALFILLGFGSITWVSLAGKPTENLGIFIEVIATPLFGLVMLVVGYYYGHANVKTRQDRN
jgi:hypothetical protein